MRPKTVIVLSYCCLTKAQAIAASLSRRFKSLGLPIAALEAEVGSLSYWDGTAAAIIAALPPGWALESPFIEASAAYMTPSEANINALADKIADVLKLRCAV